ncbi:MAG TPA: acyl-CoA dehydrogenase, partial [Thermoanaerobaculia bacterium]|nr:acyl-CoA dehydrogenase [Thermoanaerobaculia bacterium]
MMTEFFQQAPRLQNTWRGDANLGRCLERHLSAATLSEVRPRLDLLGGLAAGPMLELADRAEANPPRLVQFGPWGRRVDRVETDPAWEELLAIAARQGVVATAFERSFGAESRLAQMALLYLYHPSSAL